MFKIKLKTLFSIGLVLWCLNLKVCQQERMM
jgi:hypothetical protein